MPELTIEVPTRDGESDCVFITPEGKGPWPGVIYLTDVWGNRPAAHEMAARVAAQGYAVLMPNIFYRLHKPPFDPLLMGGERGMATAMPLISSLDTDMMVRDGLSWIDYLLGRQDVAKKLAVVGYCFSGAMAVRIAATSDKIAAAASFHGGRLVTDQPNSPHTLIPNITAELYFSHAIEDQSATPQQIAQLDDALKGWGGKYQSEMYEGARHGWTVPDSEAYNPAQSERHYEKLFALLKRTLA